MGVPEYTRIIQYNTIMYYVKVCFGSALIMYAFAQCHRIRYAVFKQNTYYNYPLHSCMYLHRASSLWFTLAKGMGAAFIEDESRNKM